MGLDACVLAIGKFTEEISSMLEYGQEAYKDTKQGTMVVTHLFHCVTTSASEDLAQALGCDEWDFNSHVVEYRKANLSLLRELGETQGWYSDIGGFVKLHEHGFYFIFLPNG